jgi:hypothetical protein
MVLSAPHFRLSALAVVLLLPTVAEAQLRRVVVEDFRGVRAAQTRGQLLANLEGVDSVEVVPRDEVRSTASALGIEGRTYSDDEVAQIAASLNASAFLRGRVSRARRRWTLTVTVVNGADGAEVGRQSWSGRTASALAAVRRSGWARLRRLVESTAAPRQRAVASASDDAEVPWYARGRATGDELPPRSDEEAEAEEREPTPSERRQDWLSFSVVGGPIYRWMNATATVLNNGREPAGPAELVETRTYESAGIGHGEIGLRIEAYPGAADATQSFPWLGAVFELRHSIVVSSNACPRAVQCDDPADRIPLGTEQFDLYLGARGRVRFGDTRSAPELALDAGYGTFGFLLDTEALAQIELRAVIPPIQYSYVHLGGAFRFDLVPTFLGVGVRGGYRAGLGVGDDARSIWGLATGAPSGFLLGVDLRSEAPYIADGVFIGLSFEYFAFQTTFRGQTQCVTLDAMGNPACGLTDPWEPWPSDPPNSDNVTGGIADPVNDNYVRLYLSAGYAFR